MCWKGISKSFHLNFFILFAADFDLPDEDEAEGGPKPYRLTAYMASLDPEPIRMVGGVGTYFRPDETLPQSFTFNISTARVARATDSTGCTWSVVTGEELVEDDDGMC